MDKLMGKHMSGMPRAMKKAKVMAHEGVVSGRKVSPKRSLRSSGKRR